ncbi:MAG: glycosyltransferase [Gaiellaceae bacterium]
MRVGYFGTWERGYPRNDQVISSLRNRGDEVREIHAPVWAGEHKFRLGPRALPRLIAAETRLATHRVRNVDVLLVGYPGQFDLWAAKRHGVPVAFNAMLSLHDTFVEDRGRFDAGSVAGKALRSIDRWAFRAADLLIADTAANASHMADLSGRDQVAHVYVGAEERLFQHTWSQPEDFNVLFVGKLIPLHGLEVILEAARLIPEVRFRVIGSGQQKELLAAVPANVEHVAWIDYERLPLEYASSGCALGIFGSSGKAGRVIPNKAFQALAVGSPLITADTPAARELLTDGKDALLVERTPEALAAAIRQLAGNPDLAARIGAAGRATFEREASETVLGQRWHDLLRELTNPSSSLACHARPPKV